MSALKSISQTHDERDHGRRRTASHVPGVLVVFSGGQPCDIPVPLEGDELVIGRGTLPVTDPLISRNHASVSYDADSRSWHVEDLGSRNGTFVDGRQLDAPVDGALRVLRTGGTISLLVDDLHAYMSLPVERDGEHIAGSKLRAARKLIERAAAHSNLHITGETGSGKELAARHFHNSGPRPSGPFVAVNCAAIPEGVAERLLFGARKGAFSGAVADADGYIQAADGGTLFLDEIADLDLTVQAKLLRVLESRQVLPLGAARPVPVDIRICSATHHDLRTMVSAKRFREDLYYRIARPHVIIPPLRERLEEIPHLVMAAIRSISGDITAHVSFVEACMVRHWPGNVRELLAEVKEAARVISAGVRTGATVMAEHLSPNAGLGFAAQAPPDDSSPSGVTPGPTPSPSAPSQPLPSREVILEALKKHQGRVATAARALGLRRNQLRRWLKSHEVDPALVNDGPDGDEDEGQA